MPTPSEDNETKLRILEIARDLFAHKGYPSVSTREIARACSLAESGIYYYFRSKRSLLETLLTDFSSILEGGISRRLREKAKRANSREISE